MVPTVMEKPPAKRALDAAAEPPPAPIAATSNLEASQ
jgi:hypothetical protein